MLNKVLMELLLLQWLPIFLSQGDELKMNIDLKYTLKKTVELLAIPSPVGYTHNAIEWVRKELESLGVKKYNITKRCINCLC